MLKEQIRMPLVKDSVPFHTVLGVKFNVLTLAQTLEICERYIKEQVPRQVSFCNAYTVTLCQKSKKLRDLINGSDLNLADGMSIVWGSRWLNIRLPGRVAGPDLTEALCERASLKGYRIFLMGSSWDTLRSLKKTLEKKFPGTQITGTFSPSYCDAFSEEETSLMLAEFDKAKADILLVGISCPKQEQWIAENLKRINIPLCLGVGAAFEFICGRIPRAPLWMRNTGLEWLHRLYCEPRRLWKRYLLGNFVFLSLLFKELVKRRYF